MGVSSFYVRVYRPAVMHEFEIEVDEDLIGLDDETQVNNSPAREALRLALQRARTGEGEQTDRMEEEVVALLWTRASIG